MAKNIDDLTGSKQAKPQRPTLNPDWDRIARGDPYFGSREMPIKYPVIKRIDKDGTRHDPKPDQKYPMGPYSLISADSGEEYWIHKDAKKRAGMKKYSVPEREGSGG